MAEVVEKKTFSGRLSGALLVSIGATSLGFATALMFVAEDSLLAFFLVGLPASFLGCIALLAGAASLSARIEISPVYLCVAAPRWRGCPLPPVRKAHLRWDEIKSLRHRTELYHLFPGRNLPMPVDTFAIETDTERIIFGGKSIPHLARAMGDIAIRSGRPVLEELSVKASILGSLVNGPPRWS